MYNRNQTEPGTCSQLTEHLGKNYYKVTEILAQVQTLCQIRMYENEIYSENYCCVNSIGILTNTRSLSTHGLTRKVPTQEH